MDSNEDTFECNRCDQTFPVSEMESWWNDWHDPETGDGDSVRSDFCKACYEYALEHY